MYEGLLYYITNFKIVASPTKWRPIAAQKSILFYYETKIENCCKGINISTLKYDIRLLSTIATHHYSTTTLIGIEHTFTISCITLDSIQIVLHYNILSLPLQTDVGGVVLEVHDLLYSSSGIEKLRLAIMDIR